MDAELRDSLAHLADIPMLLDARIPCTRLTIAEILALDEGSVLTTDRAAGESVDFSVSGQMIVQAELIVIENTLAARLSDFGEKNLG